MMFSDITFKWKCSLNLLNASSWIWVFSFFTVVLAEYFNIVDTETCHVIKFVCSYKFVLIKLQFSISKIY